MNKNLYIVITGKASAKNSNSVNEGKAKLACKTNVVRQLFQANLLPRYKPRDKSNLVRSITASYRK